MVALNACVDFTCIILHWHASDSQSDIHRFIKLRGEMKVGNVERSFSNARHDTFRVLIWSAVGI